MPPIFTSVYFIFGIIGGLLVVLMALLVFLLIAISLVIGACCCSHKPRKVHRTFVYERGSIMVTNPPFLYANPPNTTPLVRLHDVGPSTQIIQNGDPDDSNSTGPIANSNDRGRHLLPAPHIIRLGSNRRVLARSCRRSSGYSSKYEGRNRTRSPVLLSRANSGSERQDQDRGRQARSPQRRDDYAPSSNRRHRSLSPDSLSRDRSRSDRYVRNHHSDNAACSTSRSKSPHVGYSRDARLSRERSNRRGSGSEQWGSLSSDGRPGLPGLAYEATG